jgi:hypothetical protein
MLIQILNDVNIMAPVLFSAPKLFYNIKAEVLYCEKYSIYVWDKR